MVLSEIGLTAQSLWLEIPVYFDYIQLDTFVIMPNHVHGIIVIQKPDNLNNILNRTQKCRNLPNDKIIVETGITAETRFIASLQINRVSAKSPHCPLNKLLYQIALRNLRLIDPTTDFLMHLRLPLANLYPLNFHITDSNSS